MKRNCEVKPCWPLFRKKCEACGRKFRWQGGVKLQRPSDGSVYYLCARCRPPSYVTTVNGAEHWRKCIEESKPPTHHNCRCDTIIVDDVNEPGNPCGITAREAAMNFARAGAMARTRLQDIHIPRRSKKDGAP